jgi:hypothetical protein
MTDRAGHPIWSKARAQAQGLAGSRHILVRGLWLTALASLLLPAPAAHAHDRNQGKRCGSIAWEANTDDGASNIRAVGETCARARTIVRRAHAGSMRPGGYRCRKTVDDQAVLWHEDFVCRRGGRRITWTDY